MKKWLSVFCLVMLLVPVRAQQMEVTDFTRQKKGILWGLLKKEKVATDKTMAILDLTTGEKGFEFKADGTTAVKADEGDCMLTLKVPHKTTFLVIKHPEYGQLTWKVPISKLKKKKHYKATLLTYSPDKEYKLNKQWVVFNVEPAKAILTVDSTTVLIRDGEAQMELPLGKHAFRVESPFYEVCEDSLELTDSAKITIPVTLQSVYSYLTVRTPLEGCDIRVDGETIGHTIATSGRLLPGKHRVTVFRRRLCYYDGEIMVGQNEKKVLELAAGDLKARLVSAKQKNRLTLPAISDTTTVARPSTLTSVLAPKISAPVTIEAPGDSTEIFVDMEPVGRGKWSGTLAEGFHTVSSRKDSVESRIQYLWVDDSLPKTLKLSAPMADYGVLDIHSNVVGADVFLNGVKAGTTPCVVTNLPAGKSFKVLLSKDGCHKAERVVKVIPNDMVDVNIKMKIKKIKSKK